VGSGLDFVFFRQRRIRPSAEKRPDLGFTSTIENLPIDKLSN